MTSELPTTWLSVLLGDIIDYGQTDKVEPGNIPPEAWILELEDIEKDTSKLVNRLTFAERNSKSTKNRFERGDVLYGKLRPYLNKVIIASEGGYSSTEIIPLKAKNLLDNRFLFYWLKHPKFLSYVEAVSHGINMPRLGTEAGKRAPFILAPLREQKRIADKLDVLVGRVDACCERLERVPVILKRFRRSVLAAAVSGNLDRLTASSSTELFLGDCLSALKTGPFGSALHKSDYVLDGIPVINPMHIIDGKLLSSPGMTVSEQTRKRLSEFCLQADDIVIGRRGEMGRCAVVPIKSAGWLCGTGSMVLRTNKLILPEFLQLFLSSPTAVAALESDAVGSTMVNLNQKVLTSLRISLPSLETQKRNIQIARRLLSACSALESQLADAMETISRISPAMLAKAFRGELVPQDLNDESASELLARIQRLTNTTATKRVRALTNRL